MEGQGFRDRAPEFEELGVEIVGASYDTPEANKAFAENEDLPYRLVSDVDHEVGRAYGVDPGPDTDFPLAKRLTYLIDPDGNVAKVYDVGKNFSGHPGEVLSDINQLQGSA